MKSVGKKTAKKKKRKVLVIENGLRVLWNETCPQLLHFGKADKDPVPKY